MATQKFLTDSDFEDSKESVALSDEDFLTKESIRATTPMDSVRDFTNRALVQPAVEVYRGAQNATARFYRSLDNLQSIGLDRPTEFLEQIVAPARQKMVEMATGRKLSPEQQQAVDDDLKNKRFRPFKTFENIATQAADSIPRSPLQDTFIGSAYNFIGEAPITMAEWSITKGIVGGKSIEPIKNMKTMAAIGGLSEADEGYVSAIKGAVSGATVGAAFDTAIGVGFPLIAKGYQLGKTFGEGVFRTWMRGIGVSREAVDAFMKNPQKYKLWGKIESWSDKKVASKKEIEDLRVSLKDQSNNFRTQKTIENAELRAKHSEEMNGLRNEWNQKIASAENESTQRIINLQSTRKEAVDNIRRQKSDQIDGLYKRVNDNAVKADVSVRETLLNKTTKSFKEVEKLKQQAGDNVGLKIEQFLKENPFAEIPSKNVIRNFKKTFSDYGFEVQQVTKKVGKGADAVEETFEQLVPKIAGVDSTQLKQINDIFKQMQQTVTSSGGLTIAYMQDLKSALQKYGIPKNIQQPTPWESMYSKLAGHSNVANMGKESVGESVYKGMTPIFEANANYRRIMGERDKLYDLLGKKTTITDPTTGFTMAETVPDLDKMLRIKDGKLIELRRLREADAILPPDLKVGPVVNKAVDEIKSIKEIHDASLRSIRRRGEDEIARLTKVDNSLMSQRKKELERLRTEQRKATSGLAKKQAEQKLEQRLSEQKRTAGLAKKQKEQFIQLRERIDSELAFVKKQEELSTLIPTGLFGKGIQAGAGYAVLKGQLQYLPVLAAVSPKMVTTGQRIIASGAQNFESVARLSKRPTDVISYAMRIKIAQDREDNKTISEKIRERIGV